MTGDVLLFFMSNFIPWLAFMGWGVSALPDPSGLALNSSRPLTSKDMRLQCIAYAQQIMPCFLHVFFTLSLYSEIVRICTTRRAFVQIMKLLFVQIMKRLFHYLKGININCKPLYLDALARQMAFLKHFLKRPLFRK